MNFLKNSKNKLQAITNHNINGAYYYSPFLAGIYTEIEINSSEDKIYQVLTDFKKYDLWNPAITNIQGAAKEGASLKVEISWPGLSKNSYYLKLIELTPNKTIHWKGRFGMDFLFKGEHIFLIQNTVSPQKTLVKQVEIFSGLFVPFVYIFLKKNIYQGFLLLNLALKKHVEMP